MLLGGKRLGKTLEEECEVFTWSLKPPSLAQKQLQTPEKESMARARALRGPFPMHTLCSPSRDLVRTRTRKMPPSTNWAGPIKLCFDCSSLQVYISPACSTKLQSPTTLPSMARQGAGPTHLSLTAWMASAALS